MFNGKKAVTFSYDDGITQDIRLIEILNKYGLRATFNLNSQLLGKDGQLDRNGKIVTHNKIAPEDVKYVYSGHEVAVHTLTHPNLVLQDDAEVIRQVEQDRLNLSELCGYEVVGMAYPCGGTNTNERVQELVRRNTGVQYARTIISNGKFSRQENLLAFNPTAYHINMDEMFDLAKRFLEAEPTDTMIFYIWGHGYELDAYDIWDKFEEFCRLISGRKDIFYGTNKQVLLQEYVL